MKKAKTFYYQFDWLNGWFILNTSLTITLAYCTFRCPVLLFWPQTQVLIATAVFSWLVWGYKYLLKHRLAVIDDVSIKIDHCRPLFWKDVQFAEEKTVRCGLKKYRILALHPKKDIHYHYNFLQKHNGNFTPFSIPLYHIVSKQDIDEITRLIAAKVKILKKS